jgi:hypothetical protein
MDGVEVLVPIVAIFCIFGAPVLAFVVFRVLAHRERMEMIRHGAAPPYGSRDWKTVRPMAAPAPPPQAQAAEENSDDPQRMLRKGIVLSFIGLALVTGLSFIGMHDTGTGYVFHPGPWLLGGLIPLFVGLAQVIIALLSGATLGPPRYAAAPPPNIYGVPTPPPAQAGAAPTYEGSYTYRPGATQELRKPGDIERG